MARRIVVAGFFAVLTPLIGVGCARVSTQRLGPSDTPRFFVSDDATGSRYTTVEPDVRVVVEPREGFEYYIDETTEVLPPADAAWLAEAPETFTLSPGSGLKIVHLWARDRRGAISEPARYEIMLVENIILVGPSNFGCPSVDGGACSIFSGAAPNPVQRAVDIAQPGDAIWLHADPSSTTTSYEGNITFDKSVVVEPAPGQDGRAIELLGDCASTGALRLMADAVTVRGVRIAVPTECRVAINTFLSGERDDASEGWSGGHLFERLYIEALETSISGSNSTEWAITPGDNTLIRNSIIYGWWEGAVRTGGASDMSGFQFVNNTVVLVEPSPSVVLDGAEDTTVRNNILAVLNPLAGAAVVGDGSTNNAVVEGNLVSGFDAVVNSFIAEGFNTLGDPGLVHMRDLEPAQGSLAIDNGIPGADTGDTDLFGNPRTFGARVDIGAIEVETARAPIAPVVTVGLEPLGCPFATGGACEFYRLAREPPALQRAIEATPPGGEVQLFGGRDGAMARYPADDTDIDRTLRIAPAVGEEGTVSIVNSSGSDRGILRVVVADNVVLADLHFECTSCGYLVWFDSGSNSDPASRAAATDAVIERCTGGATTNEDVAHGFYMGHRGILRDSLLYGPFEGLVRVPTLGVRVVGNTFFGTESESANAVFDISGATNVVIANNLVDVSTATTPLELVGLRSDVDTLGAVLESNQLYGLTLAATGPLLLGTAIDEPAGTNCIELAVGGPTGGECSGPSPLFTDPAAADFSLQVPSPALDAGNATFTMSTTDVLGNPRVVNSVDVGAVERQP